MKKLFIYSMMLMATLSIFSCKDDDISESANRDKLFRPAFRKDDNTGKGSTDPYNCAIVDLNTAHLYWYTVDDAVAYEIKWAIQNYVANGEQAWIDTEAGVDGKELAGHVVVTDPKQFNLVIKNMNYQTQYRFAIRALHSYDANNDSWKTDPKNSDWYGYGHGTEWADYMSMETGARYDVPFVVQTSNITKTSMVVRLDRNISKYSDDEKKTFRDHFNFVDADQNVLKIDYLTFTASKSTPNATTNPTYLHFDIPESAWVNDVAEFTIDGLSENSVYNIDVWDSSIEAKVDACYNSVMKSTKGTPGAPILIKHVPTAKDTIGTGDNMNIYDISSYNSMKLDDIISNYNSDVTVAENQVFYLEGGKTYHFTDNPSLYKGLTLRTNPEDVAQGKRAKVYLGGMTKTGASVNTCNFMLGRQPNAGENSTITLDIDSVRFVDLDFDVPMATNYGHAQEGTGNAVGNYFMNMYSNGMGINVTLLEMNNCTFQGLIRGFFRIQGTNDFYIHNLKMIDCCHYNSGFYDNNGGGYNYIHADHNGKPKSNILENVEISGNVFYDSPKGSLITDSNRNLKWDASVRWNLNIHHNTFVNFMTRSTKSAWMNTRYIPGGSKASIHDNIWINTKDADDVNRAMNALGWDARNIQGGDGSGKVVFNIYNNWTTNDPYLKGGQPFNNNAFNATSNSPGKWQKTWKNELDTYYPAGLDELKVHCDTELKATDLMVSPNPQHFVGAKPSHLDHHTDKGIDGLYYQQTEKVLNSAIYKSGAGAPRLRNGKK